MKHIPSPPELVEFFNRVIPRDMDIQPRKMFGYPCVFINGNLAAGLHAHDMIMRLNNEDRVDYLKQPGAKIFEPMPGRPMKQYVVATPELIGNEAELRVWLQKSIGYSRSLPPKIKK